MSFLPKSHEGRVNGEQQLTEATATESLSSLSTLPDSALSSGDSDTTSACANKLELIITDAQLAERERIRQKRFECFPEQIKRSLEDGCHFRKLPVLIYEPILHDEQEPCSSKSRHDIIYRTIYVDLRLPIKQVLKNEWLFKLLSLEDESARANIIVQRGRVHKTIETHVGWCTQGRYRKIRHHKLQKAAASGPLTVGEVFDEQVNALHFVLNAPESFKRSYRVVALRETKRQSGKTLSQTSEIDCVDTTAINELVSTANNSLEFNDNSCEQIEEPVLTRVPSRNIFKVLDEEFATGHPDCSSLCNDDLRPTPANFLDAVIEPALNADLNGEAPNSSIIELCNNAEPTPTKVMSDLCQTKDINNETQELSSILNQPENEIETEIDVGTSCQATDEKAAGEFLSICYSESSAQPDPAECWPFSYEVIDLVSPAASSQQLSNGLSDSEPKPASVSASASSGSKEVRLIPCRVMLQKLAAAEVERYVHRKSDATSVNENAKPARTDADAYTFSWLKPSNETDLNKNSPNATFPHCRVPTLSVDKSSPTLSCPLYFSARNEQEDNSDADSHFTGCSVQSMLDHTQLHSEAKRSRRRRYASLTSKQLGRTQASEINGQSMIKRARTSNSALLTPSIESAFKGTQLTGPNYVRTPRMKTRARSSIIITRSFSRHLTAAK